MHKPLIYIVDDEPINRMILSRGFAKDPYLLKEAESGDEVLRMLDHETPELILLDIMMPGTDGLEVCRRIKQNPRTHEIPIIFVSAITEKAQRHEGLQLGASDYITKPFDLYEVRLRVNQHLKIHELYKEVKKINATMKKEIMAARKLQFNLLPESHINLSEKFEFFFEYFPCESLGGDFLDTFKLDDDRVLFYSADVSGHGIASSLVTVFVKEFFNRYKLNYNEVGSPAEILAALNHSVIKMNFSNQYLTIFLGILNINTGDLEWASAGPNTKPFIISKDEYRTLENASLAIGWFEGIEWENKKDKIDEDSILVLYSDCAIEVTNDKEEQLGIEGFEELLKNINFYEDPDFTTVVQELLDYTDELSFSDDLTLIAIKRNK